VDRVGRKGSAIVAVLLVMAILLVMGLAYLTQKVHLYRASSAAGASSAAKALAEAGLEDARIKLEKDPTFPPGDRETQTVFSYSEVLTQVGSPEQVGTYSVTVDLSRLRQQSVIMITSTGTVGDTPEQAARRSLYAEIDVSGDIDTNPKFFRFITVEDRGGL
jgi:type II secretory pathway component PulK